MTSPPYRLTWRQLLWMRWPSLLVLVLMPFLGAAPVGSMFIGCLVLHYPWQRSLYDRSQREFGPRAHDA